MASDRSKASAPTGDGAFVVIRHGATDWSESGQHTGTTDVALTSTGREQGQQVAHLLKDFSPDEVWSSPRTRTLDTARLAGFDDPIVDTDLVEWDYGVYEGLTRDQIREQDPEWTVWSGETPGGETPAQVYARAIRTVQRASEQVMAGRTILAFSHGHFSRVLMTAWCALPVEYGERFVLDPAGFCVLGVDRGTRVVQRWNLSAAD